MLKFSNPATAAKYESDFDNDPVVHLPGVRMGNGWKDRLSNISPENADRLIAQKSNLVRLKQAATEKPFISQKLVDKPDDKKN